MRDLHTSYRFYAHEGHVVVVVVRNFSHHKCASAKHAFEGTHHFTHQTFPGTDVYLTVGANDGLIKAADSLAFFLLLCLKPEFEPHKSDKSHWFSSWTPSW